MINKLAAEIHTNAKEKGWWEQSRSALEIHMLIVSEIAEATEEVRNQTPPIYQPHEDAFDEAVEPGSQYWCPVSKPEGEAVELADAIIRILDYAEMKNWDMEKIIRMKVDYNKTRSHRHGGKKY